MYDVTVVGSGAAGMMSAIVAAREQKSVLLLEKMPKVGIKLKATGGGKCNITNTLDRESFMDSFGKEGKFMRDALSIFSKNDLIEFLGSIGLKTHAPDGFRVFPLSHDSKSLLLALEQEMKRVKVDVKCKQNVQKIVAKDSYFVVSSDFDSFKTKKMILATGGLGYSSLGSSGDGYRFAKELGHSVSELYPAMLPLHIQESWVQNCRADTIAKATLRVDLPKMKSLRKKGDLIFTKNGIRGPVVLDFAREITPLLKKYKRVPLLVNLTKGMNEENIRVFFKKHSSKDMKITILKLLETLLPQSVSREFCNLLGIDTKSSYLSLNTKRREELIKLLAWTPLNVIGHEGFEKAMITRGGVSLKEIDPKSMQSKIIRGLYFCGEVVDLDGPCGGYNLQWAFSSGYLAGLIKSEVQDG